MKFREAVNKCKTGGTISRKNGYHADIPKEYLYQKDSYVPLECLVAWQDQIEQDWEVFEPE